MFDTCLELLQNYASNKYLKLLRSYAIDGSSVMIVSYRTGYTQVSYSSSQQYNTLPRHLRTKQWFRLNAMQRISFRKSLLDIGFKMSNPIKYIFNSSSAKAETENAIEAETENAIEAETENAIEAETDSGNPHCCTCTCCENNLAEC